MMKGIVSPPSRLIFQAQAFVACLFGVSMRQNKFGMIWMRSSKLLNLKTLPMSSEQKWRVGDRVQLGGGKIVLLGDAWFDLEIPRESSTYLIDDIPVRALSHAKLISRPMQKLTEEQAAAIREALKGCMWDLGKASDFDIWLDSHTS